MGIKKSIYNLIHSALGTRNIIIFKGQGDFDGNAYALYDYLIKEEYSRKYKFVWYVKDYNKYIKKKDKYTDFISSDRKSLRKIYYLSCAKYAFYDNACPLDFDAKVQNVIYLSHGVPPIKNAKGIINLSETPTTHALVSSEATKERLAEIRNFPVEKMFVCGQPRNDVIFKASRKYEDILGKKYTKVFLWMPTFRKSNIVISGKQRLDSEIEYLYGLPLIHSNDELSIINELCKKMDYLLIIKPHPNAEQSGIGNLNFSNIAAWTSDYLVSHNINIYEFFDDTYAMISDYSSCTFDFLLTEKPVGYIIDDMNEYRLGFAFDNITEYMPGDKIENLEQLLGFISNAAKDDKYCKERTRINKWANDYRDGNNSKRVAELFDL